MQGFETLKREHFQVDDASSESQVEKKVKVEGDGLSPVEIKITIPKLPLYSHVSLSPKDRAPQLEFDVDKDPYLVTGSKGYRMIRATHGVNEGTWYFEVKVMSSSHGSLIPHFRLGWSTALGDLQAPVGFDAYSYGYRDIEGTFFHQSHGHVYGQPYQVGDTIGFLIHLPQWPKDMPREPSSNAMIHSEYCYGVEPWKKAMAISPLKQDKMCQEGFMECFVNGVSQGKMVHELPIHTYYPAISIYNYGRIRLQVNEPFQYPPISCDSTVQSLIQPIGLAPKLIINGENEIYNHEMQFRQTKTEQEIIDLQMAKLNANAGEGRVFTLDHSQFHMEDGLTMDGIPIWAKSIPGLGCWVNLPKERARNVAIKEEMTT